MHRASQLLVLAVGTALALAALAAVSRPAGEATAAPAPDLSLVPQGFRLQGAGSCAAAACHNADGPPGARGCEYSTWLAHDRHARAYSVLLDERSWRIQENLNRSVSPERRVRAEHNPVCLRCHAVDPERVPPCEEYQVADGVGCENCHGPAERWKSIHFLPGFRQLDVRQKEALGFHDTKNLVVRARMCAECHVGAGPRDVNHDLIAAGHPRLNFELGLYTAHMPRHWNILDEKARYPDFEARAWLVGQVVSAETALDLLADRASGATDNRKPWPEFAEYACFACHHDLREPSDRQKLGYAGRVPGAFPWGTWYYAMMPVLAREVGAPEWEGDRSALGRLHATMSGPSPDPARVSREARAALAEMERVLGDVSGQRPETGKVLRLLGGVVRQDAARPPTSWDEAAQEYLAVAALYHGLTDLDPRYRNPALRGAIQALVGPLEPPAGYSSPVTFDAPRFLQQMETVRSRLPGR
jgi:hypothetical protein